MQEVPCAQQPDQKRKFPLARKPASVCNNALKAHKSQMGDLLPFEQRMRFGHTEDTSDETQYYVKYFDCLILHGYNQIHYDK